jgi:hypothetical protein
MGDIWPCRGPWITTWAITAEACATAGFTRSQSFVMAAIGEAESSLDQAVINDTPETGDYSVGVFQINYYDGLYAARAAAFGQPCQLVAGGVQAQAYAARAIYLQQGFGAWTTYTTGAYQKYLHGNVPPPSASLAEPPPPPPAPAPDWSGYVRLAGDNHIAVAQWVRGYRRAIQRL